VIEDYSGNIWISFRKKGIFIETISMVEEQITDYSDLTKYNLTTNNNFKELIYGK